MNADKIYIISAVKLEISIENLHQWKKFRNQPFAKVGTFNPKRKMVVKHNYKLYNYTCTALKTNKHLYQERLSVSMGVACLYSSFLVYIQQSAAVMLCTAAHIHPCRM